MAQKNIATLVLASPSTKSVNAIAAALGMTGDFLTLSNGKAIEFAYAGNAATLKRTLKGLNIDYDFCIQPAEGRKKKLLICDMDSTLIGQECIDCLLYTSPSPRDKRQSRMPSSA